MGKTALVLLDFQIGILDRVDAAKLSKCLGRVSAAAHAARAAQHPVIYIKSEFRARHPEISALNIMFAQVKTAGVFVAGDASVAIHPGVAPQEGDVVVVKRQVSAFSGSDFDAVLRGLEVDTLVMAGVATSGAVLSTLRQAADLDFKLMVLEDICLDLDEEVHRVLVEKVFPRQATVISSEEWIKDMSKV
ncbi:putative isochorismatase hydrolase protein [Mycena venus]|uniref:Putative isochorismatase hydrolase protein n=1 Tax=Mycena venus TaxID=2733690 RepID=A0A8H7DB11_9AGAR|nr:putative isochorismatase hydrolase protein [Mycena venus]